MNWEIIGTSAEVVGAAGVIITLVYLANQIRQGTRQALTDNLAAAEQRWVAAYASCVRTEEDVAFFRKAATDYAALTPEEVGRVNVLLMELVSAYGSILALSEKGLITPIVLASGRKNIGGILKCPGFLAWWEDVKDWYPTNVARDLDEVIANHSGPSYSERFRFLKPI